MDTIAVPNPHRELVPRLRHSRPSESGARELTYHEDRVTVQRSTRGDLIGFMHSRGQLGEGTWGDVRYVAARRYQGAAETLAGGQRSSGDIRERVDGGHIASDGLTDARRDAARYLARWRARLGADGASLVDAVLIKGMTLRTIGDSGRAMMPGKAATTFLGHRLRECLTTLAKDMGLVT